MHLVVLFVSLNPIKTCVSAFQSRKHTLNFSKQKPVGGKVNDPQTET